MGLVSLVFPFQDQPEYHCRKGRRIGIDLALDCREPEGVAERIDQCAHHGRGFNGNDLAEAQLSQCGRPEEVLLPDQQAPHQVRNGPIQEQNGGCRKQCTHHVHHIGHLAGVAGKLREQIGCQHEEWCPRGMADFQFVTCRDKFRTVPERGRRFDSRTIYESSNGKSQPAQDIVHESELFHCRFLKIILQRYLFYFEL